MSYIAFSPSVWYISFIFLKFVCISRPIFSFLRLSLRHPHFLLFRTSFCKSRIRLLKVVIVFITTVGKCASAVWVTYVVYVIVSHMFPQSFYFPVYRDGWNVI